MLRPDTARKATAWFVVLTVAMTWPLARGLARDVPADLGDPLLNCWILAWNATHLLRAAGGDLTALSDVWHTNIFHPAPWTLAYSELLAVQSVLATPIYALTGNILLAYNLLFLGAFVLSGLGMYLFVREITGSWRAGFIGGLLFAFTPYRFVQASHLQVMWSCWMPFVLFGLRRFFDAWGTSDFRLEDFRKARRRRIVLPLGGAAAALVAQNLSCGYYMVYFAPFVALYAIWELYARGRLLDLRAWGALTATAAVAIAATLPFMAGYFALRSLGQQARSLAQVSSFAADAYAYATAHWGSHLWGWLQTYPRAEGHLFPGLLPVLLSVVGLMAAGGAATVATRQETEGNAPAWRRRAARVTVAVAVLYWILCAGMFTGLEGRYTIGPIEVRLFSVRRLLAMAVIATVAAAFLSPAVRRWLRALVSQPAAFAAAAACLAAWLSLGPSPAVGGDPLRDATVYPWLYTHLPGLDGLRVPARFAMLVVLCLAWAGGLGFHAIASRTRVPLGPAVAALILIDSAVVPLTVNGSALTIDHVPPPATVPTRPTPLTRAIADLPEDAVLLMLPIGDVAWEVRHVYLSTFHWRRMVNGYSGDVPAEYMRLVDTLSELPEREGRDAWMVIRRSGATHAVVHTEAYTPERLERLTAWMESGGARMIGRVEGGLLYALWQGLPD
ncbi:MAG TPA: hypothetical protein VIL35_00945 [Vicinamibacterales bacterium]